MIQNDLKMPISMYTADSWYDGQIIPQCNLFHGLNWKQTVMSIVSFLAMTLSYPGNIVWEVELC